LGTTWSSVGNHIFKVTGLMQVAELVYPKQDGLNMYCLDISYM